MDQPKLVMTDPGNAQGTSDRPGRPPSNQTQHEMTSCECQVVACVAKKFANPKNMQKDIACARNCECR